MSRPTAEAGPVVMRVAPDMPVERIAERARILATITSQVRIRFSVGADRLAERVLEFAGKSQTSAADHVARLRLDDLYLATACAEGDQQAWVEFEAAHFAFIRDFAHRFLHDAAARDLADQVIADLWQRRKIERYEGRSTLRTWLGTVVANAAINASKARRVSTAIDDDTDRGRPTRRDAPVPIVSTPEGVEAERTLAALVSRAVAALEPDEKLLLQCYYEQGLTLDEMSIALGASKATLSRRLARIRWDLRNTVDELARRSFGTSADALRSRIDLGRLDLDLSVLFGAGMNAQEHRPDVV